MLEYRIDHWPEDGTNTAGSIRQALSSPLDATGMGVSVKATAMDSITPGERIPAYFSKVVSYRRHGDIS